MSNSIMYVITGVLGLSEGSSSGIFAILALSGIALSMLLSKISEKIDKKVVYFAATVLAAAYMLFVRFAGISSLTAYAVYIVMCNFGMSAFLVFVYNFLYDVVDIIEFRTQKRDSGAIFAYYSFIIKLGKAGALQLVGILLEVGGYDSTLVVQHAEGKAAILSVATVWPAALFIISALFIFIYPVTKQRIKALQAANALRREGKPYTTDGFEKLL